MLDFEITFKIRVRSPWTVFEILLTLVVIFIWRIFHGKKIVQYRHNYKRHEVDQGYSKKFL